MPSPLQEISSRVSRVRGQLVGGQPLLGNQGIGNAILGSLGSLGSGGTPILGTLDSLIKNAEMTIERIKKSGFGGSGLLGAIGSGGLLRGRTGTQGITLIPNPPAAIVGAPNPTIPQMSYIPPTPATRVNSASFAARVG